MTDPLPDIGVRPTVPALLASAVATYGDADYIVTEGSRMSFREADERSRSLAKRLVAAGAGKGTRIGVVLPSSEDFATVFLAIGRIGAIATLFSTTYRPAELRRAMRIADVQILFAPRTLLGKDYEAHLEETVDGLAGATAPFRLPSMPFLREVWLVGGTDQPWATPIEIDGSDLDDHGISDDLLAAIEDEVTPADALLVIWTSGSSADPKGVIHTHGVCVRKVAPSVGFGLQASWSHGGRILMAMPFFWVGGPQCLIGCLFTGSCLVTGERFEAASAIELIERERCTDLAGWPTMLETLRAHPDWERRDVTSLAQAPILLPRPVSSAGDGVNMGMTETFGPHRNLTLFDHPALFDYKVVDHETGASLPDGEEGEFCVRGFGLMAGMYKKEREDTFDDDGYYHTGDRGYLEGSHIFFKGRYSEMIKSGGANVAPLEVEQTLQSFPEIRHAFVFGVAHPTRGEEVVAVLVAEDDMTIDPADIRQRTNKLLSSYKVPSRIEVLDVTQVPWLASGKPDKRSMRTAVEAEL